MNENDKVQQPKRHDTATLGLDWNKPLVSILCLAYNQELYIRETLDSFVTQETTFPFEAIVHDDASTDLTTNIIREYAVKYPHIIKPIFQHENQYSKGSQSHMMADINATISTHSKYIALCEGDDYWSNPLKLQSQTDILQDNPTCGIVWGKARCFNQYNNTYGDFFGKGIVDVIDLFHNNVIPTATTMLTKMLYSQYEKEIDPRDKGWLLGDYPLWLYCCINASFCFIDEELAVYRVLCESASHSKDIRVKERFINSVFDMKQYFIKRYDIYDEKQNEARRYDFLMCNAIEYNDYNQAIVYYKNIPKPTRKQKVRAWLCRMRLLKIAKRVFK